MTKPSQQKPSRPEPPPRYNEDEEAQRSYDIRRWYENTPRPPNPYDTERR